MATTMQPNLLTGVQAGADLSSSQYKAVKLDASGDVVIAGAGDKAIGILQNAPLSGDYAQVAFVGGGSFAIAGGTINEGDFVKVDANGDVVTVTDPGDFAIGRAKQTAVDNDCFEVLVLQKQMVGTVVSAQVSDISTASSTAYLVAPIAGTISKIQSVIDGAIVTADAILTGNIAGTPITGGAITVAFTGSAAGIVDSVEPTAANTVAAGDSLTIVSDGGSTNAVAAEVFVTILA